ncbi:MAG TPA: DUF4058 family protein [Isosphaeraceae bacterium]
MPSPFPGMDPYLEGSSWMNVHAQLSAEIARQLAPRLRPRYLALMTERFVLEMPEDLSVTTSSLSPDVGVVGAGPAVHGRGDGAIATAPLRLATVMPEAIPHLSVEIRDRANRRLVTAIEVLSSTNKRGEGRDEYLAKRRRLLLSTAHLLEIDLLREGQRVPMQTPLPSAPYFVFLSRAESRPMTEVWPIPLEAPLPVVPVPLLPGDPDVPLDLQLALTTLYDLLGYDLAVDYTRPPEVPLRPEAVAWVEDRLRAAGPRS